MTSRTSKSRNQGQNSRTDRGASRRQSGQALLTFVFFLVVLILFVGLGIDVGFAYITKANLSKAVDASCLAGMRSLSQGTVTASAVANSTFLTNYGKPGRDTGPVTPNIVLGVDANNNKTLTISATAAINTFFIRVFPKWKTLQVSASGQATRAKLVMSLVLDRSGSMNGNGGAANLPSAVTNFVNFFDDQSDRVSMNSFAYHARTDVPMAQPFKAPITAAVKNLVFDGWTVSEQGLAKGLQQNQSVVIAPGDNVIKVIVFFTDGLANTFQYTFNCGVRNISPDRSPYDPNTGAAASGGCTIPGSIPSVSPPPANVNTSDDCAMETEAQKRAVAMAELARQQGNIIYAVGLGNPNGPKECGFPPINPDFLKQVANDPTSPSFNPNEPAGEALLTSNATQLQALFQQIAAKILLRLTQ
jgi:Flp pilus assembly protein TadG